MISLQTILIAWGALNAAALMTFILIACVNPEMEEE